MLPNWRTILILILLLIDCSHALVSGNEKSNDARLRPQRGLDHPVVVIDFPSLECVCHYAIASSFSSDRERGGDASSHGSTCRSGDQASWIFSVSGLVQGFSYRLNFKWSLADEQLGALVLNISTTTSSYAVRTPVAERGHNGTSIVDLIVHSRKLRMDVAVWDVYPGLTEEEALIGARHMHSAVNTVRVRCIDSDSGERTKVPDGEENQWHYNFSAAVVDVRISYSETVVALAMLNRYGLGEWARNSQNVSDDGHTVSDLHIPAVVFNHKQDGRRAWAEGMLRAVGFRDITFQPTYESAALDLAALENSGRVSANWDYQVKEMGWNDMSTVSKMRYIAHALDFQDAIAMHAASAADTSGASSWIAVFEDDIVLTTSPVQAHKRLVEAVSSLPRNADVLYVEWCLDECEDSRFHTKYPLISLASKPHCSAGVLFSTQGAKKLDIFLRPIDSTIDNMFANLCRGSAVICYKLRLPIFTQDRKWGSAVDFTKQKVAPHFHDFSLNLCNEVIHFDSDFWSWFDSVRNGYTDGPSSSADGIGRHDPNSTACSSRFLKEREEISDKMAFGPHGLDHPAVVIDFPSLECVCDYSNTSYISSDRERGGDASSRGGTCRAGDQVSWIFSVSGLVPGFLYRLHFKWTLEGGQLGALYLNISTTTSSYAVRTPVAESGQNGTSIVELIAHGRKLRMEVAVWDMYPGLTDEEALMGRRHMDSAVNTVRVRCSDLSGVAWRRNTSAWVDDMIQYYREAVYNVHRYDDLGWDAHANDAGPKDLDNVKAFILNHDAERRISSHRMVRAAGFDDIEFPSTLAYQEQDLEALAASGDIAPNFMAHQTRVLRQKYAAHVLDYRITVTRALKEAHEWVAIFEDDIVLTTPPSVASARIRQALAQVPPDTDSIHMEWCFDECNLALYHPEKEAVSTTANPHCSAAVLFSKRGLRKLQGLLQPASDAIDNILAKACLGRNLTCYKLRVPVYAQDLYWGSSFDKSKNETKYKYHMLDLQRGLLCVDLVMVATDEGKVDARQGQHGIDHPAVFIGFPSLECDCGYSNTSSFLSDRERRSDASSHGGTCRAGDRASWILSVSGLVPGFVYKLDFEWYLDDEEELVQWDNSVISTDTGSYTVRMPLTESGQNGTSIFDLIAHSRKLRMGVAVWVMYPGLTDEEALMGKRRMDSAVNTVRILCSDLSGVAWRRNTSGWVDDMIQYYPAVVYNVHRKNDLGWDAHANDAGPKDLDNVKALHQLESGERTSVLDKEEDEWLYNASAVMEKVRNLREQLKESQEQLQQAKKQLEEERMKRWEESIDGGTAGRKHISTRRRTVLNHTSSAVVRGLPETNTTTSRTRVIENSLEFREDFDEAQVANGQHGNDHPAVVINFPKLECECKFSHGASTLEGKEKGGDVETAAESACREEGEVYWIVSVRGLVAGFKYEFHFQSIVEGDHYLWKTIFSTNTSSHTVRQPISQISQKTRGLSYDTIVGKRRWRWYRGQLGWDALIPKKEPFEIEVTVRDMHPGLTSEEALVGTRRVNSDVNAVQVLCTESESKPMQSTESESKPMNSCSFLFPFVQFDEKSGVTPESLLHENVCFVSMHPAMEPSCEIVFEELYSSNFFARGYPFPLPGITSISEFCDSIIPAGALPQHHPLFWARARQISPLQDSLGTIFIFGIAGLAPGDLEVLHRSSTHAGFILQCKGIVSKMCPTSGDVLQEMLTVVRAWMNLRHPIVLSPLWRLFVSPNDISYLAELTRHGGEAVILLISRVSFYKTESSGDLADAHADEHLFPMPSLPLPLSAKNVTGFQFYNATPTISQASAAMQYAAAHTDSLNVLCTFHAECWCSNGRLLFAGDCVSVSGELPTVEYLLVSHMRIIEEYPVHQIERTRDKTLYKILSSTWRRLSVLDLSGGQSDLIFALAEVGSNITSVCIVGQPCAANIIFTPGLGHIHVVWLKNSDQVCGSNESAEKRLANIAPQNGYDVVLVLHILDSVHFKHLSVFVRLLKSLMSYNAFMLSSTPVFGHLVWHEPWRLENIFSDLRYAVLWAMRGDQMEKEFGCSDCVLTLAVMCGDRNGFVSPPQMIVRPDEYLHLSNLKEYVYNWRQRVPVDDRKEVTSISELLTSQNEELSLGKTLSSSLHWAILPNYHSPAQFAPADHVLSLALHMDISRLKLIELTCLSWSGPMSVSIFIRNQNDVHLIDEIIRLPCAKTRARIHLVKSLSLEIYAVNVMRNVAVVYSGLPWVFMIDADFIPIIGTRQELELAIQSTPPWSPPRVFVAMAAYAKKPITLPINLSTFFELPSQGERADFGVYPVDGSCDYQSHGPTDYIRWLSESRPYRVHYTTGYEPYFAANVRSDDFPFWDERFTKWGCDKQEHADELSSRGYEFWVIPKAGLVHHPHDRMVDAWPTDHLLQSMFHWRLPGHIHFLAKIFGHPIADAHFSKIPLNSLDVEEQNNEIEKRLIHLRLIFQSTHMVSPVATDKLFAA